MRKLAPDEIEPLEVYAGHRDQARKEAMERRRRRRVALGDRLSLSFENRDTVRYQVQEMCHAEGLVRRDQIEHEVRTYNQLVPGDDELSATLMIELTEPGRIQADLDALVGLDRPGVLTARAGQHTLPVEWEPGHSEQDRIAAVQYVKFKLTPPARAALAAGAELLFVVAHPRYPAMARASEELSRELAADLEG